MPELNNVRITVDGLAELNGNQINVSMPRATIIWLALRFGCQSERPVRQIGFGVALVVLGFLPILRLITGSGLNWMVEITMFGFTIIGGWMIYSAIRKGWYIEAATQSCIRKLAFTPSRPTTEELDAFLRTAAELGYEIENHNG